MSLISDIGIRSRQSLHRLLGLRTKFLRLHPPDLTWLFHFKKVTPSWSCKNGSGFLHGLVQLYNLWSYMIKPLKEGGYILFIFHNTSRFLHGFSSLHDHCSYQNPRGYILSIFSRVNQFARLHPPTKILTFLSQDVISSWIGLISGIYRGSCIDLQVWLTWSYMITILEKLERLHSLNLDGVTIRL